jgi:hypothetical protein
MNHTAKSGFVGLSFLQVDGVVPPVYLNVVPYKSHPFAESLFPHCPKVSPDLSSQQHIHFIKYPH